MLEYVLHAPGVVGLLRRLPGVLPLAGLMGEATEHLAHRTGPEIGGLLNATFGNAAELIIAIVALQAGLIELVKASHHRQHPRQPAAHPRACPDRRRHSTGSELRFNRTTPA